MEKTPPLMAEIKNVNVSLYATDVCVCEMLIIIIVLRPRPISPQCVSQESDKVKSGRWGRQRDERGRKTRRKTSVHVNITFPLSQTINWAQDSNWEKLQSVSRENQDTGESVPKSADDMKIKNKNRKNIQYMTEIQTESKAPPDWNV